MTDPLAPVVLDALLEEEGFDPFLKYGRHRMTAFFRIGLIH